MEGHRQLYPAYDEDEDTNVEGDTAPLIANVQTLKQKFEKVPILWYLLVCVTLLGLEEFIQKAPTVRLIESAICRQHYSSVDHQGPIDEPMCKLDAIQQRLAFIQGRQGLFDALAGIFTHTFAHLPSHHPNLKRHEEAHEDTCHRNACDDPM